MPDETHDQTIERIEADLRESRFTKWDAETFLEDRHNAKIAELRRSESRARTYWLAFKEVGGMVLSYVGFATLAALAGYALLSY